MKIASIAAACVAVANLATAQKTPSNGEVGLRPGSGDAAVANTLPTILGSSYDAETGSSTVVVDVTGVGELGRARRPLEHRPRRPDPRHRGHRYRVGRDPDHRRRELALRGPDLVPG